MENPTTTSRGPKIALMGGIAVLAVVAIVYFSFFYPPAKTEDVSGTISAAKKYRSEQITDNDVKLEGQNDQAIAATESIADVQAAHEFAATAAVFENSFKALDNRYRLDATFRSTYQRTAQVMSNLARTMERAPVNTYDARAIADLRSTATTLERTASSLTSQNARFRLDNAAVLDMRAKMSTLSAQASSLDRAMAITMENRAQQMDSRAKQMDNKAQQMDSRAKQMDSRAKQMDNKAQQMDNKAGQPEN